MLNVFIINFTFSKFINIYLILKCSLSKQVLIVVYVCFFFQLYCYNNAEGILCVILFHFIIVL